MRIASPSSRRAWIEIEKDFHINNLCGVALLTEGVDRNACAWQPACASLTVALLTEGVDRNSFAEVEQVMNLQVALLTEGVDRNKIV